MIEARHTIFEATCYTRQQLVGHVVKRAEAKISRRELIKDAKFVANVINIQAKHLEQSSSVLLKQAVNLTFDVIDKTRR